MKIKSITRNTDYASWTVVYVHEEVEHTVIINLNSKTSLLESIDNTNLVPPFAKDLIRDELARKGEILRSFCDESICLVKPERWAA